MRILVCPDSYKGLLDAAVAARVMETAIRLVFPEAQVDCCPMADGGEGTLRIWAEATKSRVVDIPARDPFGTPAVCQAAIHPESGDVLLEAAQTCGLPPPNRRVPERMLSTGLGMAMQHVLDSFPRARILVALGGTGTVDGGLGAAVTLGLRLFSGNREIFPEGILDLPEDLRVEFSCPFDRPPVFLCDTKAPLLGPSGAVALFGAQKGVSASVAPAFEQGLFRLAHACARAGGGVFADSPGFGAAGGMAMPFGLLCSAVCAPGASAVMEAVDFARRLHAADLVVTGEGRLDATSFTGKLVGEIHAACRKAGRELWVFPGQAADMVFPPGMRVFPASPGALPPDAEAAARDLFAALTRAIENFCKIQLS